MFNIKKKIYVAQDGELVDLMYERTIVLHSQYSGALSQFDNINDDVTNKGAVAEFNSYDDMLKNMFDDDIVKFHEFLNQEEDLLIIAKNNDYARLYSEMQIELKKDFGVTDENLRLMRDMQRMKDFFQGNQDMRKFCYAQNPGDSSFDRIFKRVDLDYRSSGMLFRNVSELPFEVIYAMYKWGNLSKTQADTKVALISEGLLLGQVQNVLEQAKVSIGQDFTILQEYMNDTSINSVDAVIKVIFGDPLLTYLFCHPSSEATGSIANIDISSDEYRSEVRRLCSIIISKDLDFDSQPEVDQQELDFFFELYEKKDIDVIETAKFNFISTGMVATKQTKFNAGLIMSV